MTMTSTPTLLLRRVFGVLRIAGGLLLLAAIVTQVVDESVHRIFIPGQYFVYFTNQTGMMNVLVLLVGGVIAVRALPDTRLLTNIRVAIFSYEIVTALVYNGLLRGLHTPGYQGIHWPTEVLHVAIPVFVVIDWIVTPGAVRVRWRALWFAAIYPTAWILFTMTRGLVTGWYPYPFLDPSAGGGCASAIGYIVGIAVLILGLAAIGILISRRRTRAAAS
ncbi:MAG: Pr6Pr family membrane protein [Actinomycetota bacterium]